MEKLNVAVIGCGTIFPVHADAIIKSKHSKLYAVCDIDNEIAYATGKNFNCLFYTDYLEMLENETIDIVHICTPHYLHAQMAVAAMKAGKHVLTEKPMAIRVDDALEMIRVSRETGMKLGVCFQNRFNNTSVIIKDHIESGRTGKILGAKAFVTWNRDEHYYSDKDWKGRWKTEGGGVSINQAIHTLDLLQWFLGEADRLKANVDTRLLNDLIEVEDTAEATIIFKNGAKAIYYATNCYVSNSPVEIEIICEKATMRLNDDLHIYYSDGTNEKYSEIDRSSGKKAYWGSSHKVLINDFYEKITSNDEFSVNGEEGITVLRIIDLIYKSSSARKFLNFK